jgi:ABC-type antimicrobial peptide transport system permease subunit
MFLTKCNILIKNDIRQHKTQGIGDSTVCLARFVVVVFKRFVFRYSRANRMAKLGIYRISGYFDGQIIGVDFDVLGFGLRNVDIQTQF